jgi:hypothetical protein
VRKVLSVVFVLALAGVAALQLVPYGRQHNNPPVLAEPVWDAPQTRELAQRACFDCHSNETNWPWYSNVAPMSWLVYRDVERGRHELNFSQWGRGEQEADDAAETVIKRKMPPMIYIPLHPEANLSDAERRSLADGLTASLGGEGSESENERDGGRDGGRDDGDDEDREDEDD